MSGGAKKAIGFLCNEQFDITLCFLGAGGHETISGNRNLWAFGVEHELVEISTSSKSKPSILEQLSKLVLVIVVVEEELEDKSSTTDAS